ncbi:MAG TPA: cysteine--tRNA ligase [Bacteroidia bacterium]|nr:cysteine--tRNA ligase [Bacteroidia bacterium]
MASELHIYNSLTRTKEKFRPLNPPFVGMYVCGPTVYGEPHLGHSRPYITFDVVFRYLTHLGYKVRYVRNITDVGHLADEVEGTGEDRIQRKARIEKLEPMEIAQMYANSFQEKYDSLNILHPSIEPRASGHVYEQVAMIEKIIANGFAYEANGSVYFDVVKYSKTNKYGELSGRVIEELIAGAGNERRTLEGQEEKRNREDFALWKKASPEHIMRWPSPWSEGFPGWHIECSAMSTKYLGETFDIHGGGMDLLFPHHESEIAQSKGACGKPPVRFWMHNNMITINGQKMSKSLDNFITLEQLFTGELLEQSYSPMTVRFYILQAHYRSTVDFSNEALQSAEKAYKRLLSSYELLAKLSPSSATTSDVKSLRQKCYDALNDDFNTAIAISHLFEAGRIINSAYAGTETITAADISELKNLFDVFLFQILGMKNEKSGAADEEVNKLMKLLLTLRAEAKAKKDFAMSDEIRNELQKLNYMIKDEKDGTNWSRG